MSLNWRSSASRLPSRPRRVDSSSRLGQRITFTDDPSWRTPLLVCRATRQPGPTCFTRPGSPTSMT